MTWRAGQADGTLQELGPLMASGRWQSASVQLAQALLPNVTGAKANAAPTSAGVLMGGERVKMTR